jgi:hypothetical protein
MENEIQPSTVDDCGGTVTNKWSVFFFGDFSHPAIFGNIRAVTFFKVLGQSGRIRSQRYETNSQYKNKIFHFLSNPKSNVQSSGPTRIVFDKKRILIAATQSSRTVQKVS